MFNQEQRLSAQYTLLKYREISERADGTLTDVTALITDLLHYAHAAGIDTRRILKAAKEQFELESEGTESNAY